MSLRLRSQRGAFPLHQGSHRAVLGVRRLGKCVEDALNSGWRPILAEFEFSFEPVNGDFKGDDAFDEMVAIIVRHEHGPWGGWIGLVEFESFSRSLT